MTLQTREQQNESTPEQARATPSPATHSPLPVVERIETLDVLRGVALFGIFLVNVQTFAHSLFVPPPAQDGSADGIVQMLRELLFAGKFNLMFGLVFGIGFSLQLRRLERSDPASAARVYLRRLCALLGIALAHAALLWMGDVLVAYSVLGLVLLAIRRIPDRALIALVAVCLVYPSIADMSSRHILSDQTVMQSQFDYAQLAESNDAAFGHGSFVDAVRENLRIFEWAYFTPMGLFNVFAFFVQMGTGILAGFYVGRRRWIERVAELGAPLRRAHIASLAVALIAGTIWWALGGPATDDAGGGETVPVVLARTIGRFALMSFYTLSIVRLVAAGVAPRVFAAFANAGRMPLTNYLMQTVMGLAVFYGWGLGLWGRTGPLVDVCIATALFLLVQLPLSAWWLSRFRYGPVEAVWRRLTYGAAMR